jgi:esterase/lipase superfamily enzyme
MPLSKRGQSLRSGELRTYYAARTAACPEPGIGSTGPGFSFAIWPTDKSTESHLRYEQQTWIQTAAPKDPIVFVRRQYVRGFLRVFWCLILLAHLLVVAAALVGCASRPDTGFLTPATGPALGATDHALLVATTRERDARPGALFSGERSGVLDYAAITVSVPPNHASGDVEWPSTPPGNPNTDFVVRKAEYLSGDQEFVRALNMQLAMRPRGSRKVMIFVHGFNTLFSEGLYRLAQVDHDAQTVDVPVLFSWASRGKVTDYIYDSNSATAARDDLAHTLSLLFASDAEQVNILAHSMGNWVTVEALRQIAIAGRIPHNEKLGSVFLAAPDIDLDVFKSELRQFPEPRRRFYVIVSKDDQALQISSLIAGGKARLGSDGNTSELVALGATVIDLTDINAMDPTNHGKFAQLATIAPQLLALLAQGLRANRESASSLTLQGHSVKVIAGR